MTYVISQFVFLTRGAYHHQNLLFIKETFKTFMRGPVKMEGNVGVEPTYVVLQTTD